MLDVHQHEHAMRVLCESGGIPSLPSFPPPSPPSPPPLFFLRSVSAFATSAGKAGLNIGAVEEFLGDPAGRFSQPVSQLVLRPPPS